MNNLKKRLALAKKKFDEAEFFLIGAGAGLSASAGLTYSGERFNNAFPDFIEKYKFTDMYTSSFYPFKTDEEKWAYWARHIFVNRYEPPALDLYKKLYDILHERDYFIITTNVDHQLRKAGFPDERLFATQGDYGFLQCANGCHKTLYYNEELVLKMINNISDCRVPGELVPKCPVCRGDMDVNLRKDSNFVEDLSWEISCGRYESFIERIFSKRTVFLELGVGFNTPGIIRNPFEQLTYNNPEAVLIRINKNDPDGIPENRAKTISFDEDLMEILSLL